MSKLADKLLEDARLIVSNNGLPSGRMFMLDGLIQKVENDGKISKQDLGMLQFLALEGSSESISDD